MYEEFLSFSKKYILGAGAVSRGKNPGKKSARRKPVLENFCRADFCRIFTSFRPTSSQWVSEDVKDDDRQSKANINGKERKNIDVTIKRRCFIDSRF